MADEIEVQASTETAGVNTDINDWSDIAIDEPSVSESENALSPEATESPTPEVDKANQAELTEGEADKAKANPAETKEADQLILKYMGEEKAVSREEAVTLAQKGMDYDRQRQKMDEISAEKAKLEKSISLFDRIAKQQGFAGVDALADETEASILANEQGIDITIAREKVAVEREKREVAAEKERMAAERAEKDTTALEAKKEEERKEKDILAFTTSFPDVKPSDIPAEVWKAVGKGESLVSAYRDYKSQQEITELKTKLKNTENKQRTTGSMSTAGNKVNSDPWLADLEARL